jgi:hypothetical protein
MKRILLACFLLTATCTASFISTTATAQTIPPVTTADFTAKVNLMDTYIGAGNLTAAQTTWNEIHPMMLSVLSKTKQGILTATTPAENATYTAILTNQRTLYSTIWNLKSDLATNRVAIHTKLVEFAATIY